jgi:hypothetical protein
MTVAALGAVGAAVAMRAADRPPDAAFRGAAMVDAADTFLGLLDAESRARATFAFGDEERFNWVFVPASRLGLPLKDMTGEQRSAAHRLLQTILSSQGYLKTTGVMQLEGILGVMENRPDRRDPEDYYVSIFGTPSGDAAWGWRFEGHHLSLNFTSVTNEVVVSTPSFMGTNPHRVPSGANSGWRVLGAEEDLARELLRMLDDAQRTRAVIAAEAPSNIITTNDRRVMLEAFEGLAAAEMTEPQRGMLTRVIEEYVHNLDHDAAHAQMQKIMEAGFDGVYFAWAGGSAPGEGHYYRVHGPTFLVEYDNTQNNANHVHSVWRDLTDDFGEDLLRRHYDEADHHDPRP